MDTNEKLRILGNACKMDACSCMPAMRVEKTDNRIGDGIGCSITHSATPDGRPVSLFKVLYTNACNFDCGYCPSRHGCGKRIAMFGKEELAKTFMNLYVRNYVEGLFLSSGVVKDPDFTMGMILDEVRLLREKFLFRGYVHLKVMPGTSKELIKQAGEVADRLSINMESPSQSRLSEISSMKSFETDILKRQRWMNEVNVKAGHSTQFVVGAAGETDEEILTSVNQAYQERGLQKAYYSSFAPLCGTPLGNQPKTPVRRERSLYQADFLMRSYHYSFKTLKSILIEGMLPAGDPKFHLALQEFDRPADVNELPYEELLKIPGIGHLSAQRILRMQQQGQPITKREQLKHIGVVLKRAEPFLKVNGRAQVNLRMFAS